MNTRTKGSIGENLAVKTLKKQKYKIIERNFSCQFGEIDIIAQHESYVVFVEVKSRESTDFGLPRLAVNVAKQQTIITCAKYWLTINNQMGKPVRFDVVEIVGKDVNVIANAFQADYKYVGKR